MYFKLLGVAEARLHATEEGKASEEILIRGAIAELEAREKVKKKVDLSRKDNVPLRNRIVKLIFQ